MLCACSSAIIVVWGAGKPFFVASPPHFLISGGSMFCCWQGLYCGCVSLALQTWESTKFPPSYPVRTNTSPPTWVIWKKYKCVKSDTCWADVGTLVVRGTFKNSRYRQGDRKKLSVSVPGDITWSWYFPRENLWARTSVLNLGTGCAFCFRSSVKYVNHERGGFIESGTRNMISSSVEF